MAVESTAGGPRPNCSCLWSMHLPADGNRSYCVEDPSAKHKQATATSWRKLLDWYSVRPVEVYYFNMGNKRILLRVQETYYRSALHHYYQLS